MRYVLFIITIVGLASCATPFKKGVITESPTSAIKEIAILPFNVSPDTNRLLNGVTAESILKAAKMSRYRFQKYLYIWFTKNQNRYNVTFQEFNTTNDRLKKAGIYNSVERKIKQEIWSLLDVDAIVFGDMHLVKTMSKEGTDMINGIVGLPVATSNKINLEISIYGSTGRLKWKQMYQGRGTLGDESLIDHLMKRVSKSIWF